MASTLTIGAFSRRSRLSMKALRLYERLGLLVPAAVDRGSRYRHYHETQLATARLIALLRRLDMPLAQVGEVIAASGPEAADFVSRYWREAERRVASQRELAAHIEQRLRGGDMDTSAYVIRERDVPEQLFLIAQRHVRVPELEPWIGEAADRLIAIATRHGGIIGPCTVIYHGEVNEDSDGPVEVCLPVDPSQEGAIPAATRREFAHREAYTRIKKAQVAFPQILSAYDAVAHWIGAQKRHIAGPPREVYFADFAAAGPNDEVCDIAFPIRA